MKSQKQKKNIAIFASGTGTNAQKIIEYFNSPGQIRGREIMVVLLVTNNPASGIFSISKKSNIPVLLIEKSRFYNEGYVAELHNYKINLIVLAGFLWKIPSLLIQSYPDKIINIHPALLPEFGGKGMYGSKVHEAVINAGEKESGITIHYVDEFYDHGKIIFQVRCKVDENDTQQTLSQKIHALEHKYYPGIIEEVLFK